MTENKKPAKDKKNIEEETFLADPAPFVSDKKDLTITPIQSSDLSAEYCKQQNKSCKKYPYNCNILSMVIYVFILAIPSCMSFLILAHMSNIDEFFQCINIFVIFYLTTACVFLWKKNNHQDFRVTMFSYKTTAALLYLETYFISIILLLGKLK
jgi:hypothetical protein